MSARSARDRITEADGIARVVTWHGTEPIPSGVSNAEPDTEQPSRPTARGTRSSAGRGSTLGKKESGSEVLTSALSDGPSKTSSGQWLLPANTRAFVRQANEVMTAVLNGEIDIDKARVYGSIARVMAQMMSVQERYARFLREAPNLSLTDSDIDEEEDNQQEVLS